MSKKFKNQQQSTNQLGEIPEPKAPDVSQKCKVTKNPTRDSDQGLSNKLGATLSDMQEKQRVPRKKQYTANRKGRLSPLKSGLLNDLKAAEETESLGKSSNLLSFSREQRSPQSAMAETQLSNT